MRTPVLKAKSKENDKTSSSKAGTESNSTAPKTEKDNITSGGDKLKLESG